MNLSLQICKAFNRHAKTYAKHSIVQKEIGSQMLKRLAYFNIKPKNILDLGCGNAFCSAKLKKLYKDARVIGVDFSSQMLQEASIKSTSNLMLCCANILQLPFAANTFDLIFSNQVLHWVNPYTQFLQEAYRVLKPNGCLLFSTLGPDSFMELNKAWKEVDTFAHAHEFLDMHTIGDELLKLNFLDPVMDKEEITIHYPSVSAVVSSIKAQGVRNINNRRNKGLTTKRAYKKFIAAYEKFTTSDGLIPLSYEVIQGHAWKGMQYLNKTTQEVFVAIDILNANEFSDLP